MTSETTSKFGGDSPRGFFTLVILCQIALLILYAFTTEYNNATGETEDEIHRISVMYPVYQDVHVMIFIGFGFLMIFLKRWGWSSVGYNFVVSVLAIQWGILIAGYWKMAFDSNADKTIKLTITSLVEGDFAAGACLISMGALIGRVTPTQLLAMTVIELVFYALNFEVGAIELETVDMGGSMFVHTFGAYFGLAVSLGIGKPLGSQKRVEALNGSIYGSDIFAMIGTIFLWMFWPSFNGALAPVDETFGRERVVINTVLSLCGSCMMAFAFSRLISPGQKFDMVHIQNATLAGGVAVGSSADLVIEPWGAILTGMIAGTLSVIGYVYITPWLEERMGIIDICGIHNLHGMPGVMGGIGGAISCAAAGEEEYGENITNIFGGRSHRTAGEQAANQIYALLITLGIAMVSGVFTGCLLSNKIIPGLFNQETAPFSDENHWLLEEEDEEDDKEVVSMNL